MPDINIKPKNATSENNYALLEDAYYATGGFNDAGYLVRHERELDAKYDRRKAVAYYLNYTKPLVDAHVNPIFRKEAVRDLGSGDTVYEQFLKDVDCCNTPLPRFIKHASTIAKLKGSVFIIVDTSKEQPATKAGVIENRAFPYCFTVDPAAVKRYYVSKTGRLLHFAYNEASEQDSSVVNVREWTPEEWRLYNDKDELIDYGVNPLGRVPVVIFRSCYTKPSVIFPPSEFMAIAKINKQLFNRCSWLDEILIGQAFSLFIYPDKEPADLTIGVNNAIGFDGATSHFAPAFIAPSADPANMLMSKIDMMIAEMYRMAGASNVTGVKNALSGTAKQWDYESLNNILSDFAFQCQQAETEVVSLFGLWMGGKVNYSVSYPTDFSITDVTNELDNALKAQTLTLGKTFDQIIAQKVLSAYAPSLDLKTKKNVLGEVEQIADDKKNAEAAAADAANSAGTADNGGKV